VTLARYGFCMLCSHSTVSIPNGNFVYRVCLDVLVSILGLSDIIILVNNKTLLYPHSHLIKTGEGLTVIIFVIMETAHTVFSLPLMDRVSRSTRMLASYLERSLSSGNVAYRVNTSVLSEEFLERHVNSTSGDKGGVSKSFRTGRLTRELQMVQLFVARCSCIAVF
jgi:hypothetical protein